MIDYATAEDRLGTSLDYKRARAWGYLNRRGISTLYHGFRPTPACATDVAATWAKAEPGWADCDYVPGADGGPGHPVAKLPIFVRKQAA